MRSQKAIVKIIPVVRKGEVRHFQIRIPREAEGVIGIETSLRMKTLPVEVPVEGEPMAGQGQGGFLGNTVVAVVRLQSCEKSNLFFSGEIYQSGDDLQNGEFPNRFFTPREWTHGYRREILSAEASGESTILQGILRDRIGEKFAQDIQYEVSVVVWYRKLNAS